MRIPILNAALTAQWLKNGYNAHIFSPSFQFIDIVSFFYLSNMAVQSYIFLKCIVHSKKNLKNAGPTLGLINN